MFVNAYLMFDGRCEEAMTFYQQCLGGTIEAKVRYADMPGMPPMDAAIGQRIAHMRLVTEGCMLMASDSDGRHPNEGYKGFYIAANDKDPDRAEAIFHALSKDAVAIMMPLAETSWALRFGQLTDKFGVRWMVNCER